MRPPIVSDVDWVLSPFWMAIEKVSINPPCPTLQTAFPEVQSSDDTAWGCPRPPTANVVATDWAPTELDKENTSVRAVAGLEGAPPAACEAERVVTLAARTLLWKLTLSLLTPPPL